MTATSAAPVSSVRRPGRHPHRRTGHRRARGNRGGAQSGFAATTTAGRRSATAWTDDNAAPGGHNGCDTRNDILDRDLIDKTYVSIKRCPDAVATGTLHDPYTNATVAFVRGDQVGASVQIDHIVPLALAWDLGARTWTDEMRLRFANDPANLLAVDGPGQPGQGRPGAGDVDAAEHGVLVSVRDAVHRGAARLWPAGRRAVGDRAAGRRRYLSQALNKLRHLHALRVIEVGTTSFRLWATRAVSTSNGRPL